MFEVKADSDRNFEALTVRLLDDPTQLGSDYSNDEIKFMVRHFLGPDPLLEPLQLPDFGVGTFEDGLAA